MAYKVVRIPLSDKQVAYLEALQRVGLWGGTLEEVCLDLVLHGIQDAWPILADELNEIAHPEEEQPL
jgi:hypothetical protein